MPLAERGLIFEDRADAAPSHPNRTDIACFVGEIDVRTGQEGDAPAGKATVGSWDDFDRIFAWDERPVDLSDELAVCPLGAAVQSFFREGGRQCYVIRTGAPRPFSLAAPADVDARIEAMIPGYPAAFSASPADRASWRGMGHLFGLEDVSFLALPDLPELVSAPAKPRAAKPVTGPPREEVFVQCSEELSDPPPNRIRTLLAPRATIDGYTTWAKAISTITQALGRYRHDVQLVAGVPLPMSGERLDDVFAVLLDELGFLQGGPEDRLDGLAGAFLQLCYPWLKTPASDRLAEGIENPEGVLAGLLARNSLTRGAYSSACPVAPVAVYDVSPALTREQMLLLRPDRKGFKSRHAMVDRISLFGPRPAGIRLLSDVTTSLNETYRPACVNRLMSLVVRAARVAGADVVFEDSGPATWGLLAGQIGALLEDLYELGALRGAGAGDSYTVRCDRTTMTENDLDNGRLIVEVTFQAAAPVDTLRVLLTMESGGRVSLAEVA
jgi:hypothetical protein